MGVAMKPLKFQLCPSRSEIIPVGISRDSCKENNIRWHETFMHVSQTAKVGVMACAILVDHQIGQFHIHEGQLGGQFCVE